MVRTLAQPVVLVLVLVLAGCTPDEANEGETNGTSIAIDLHPTEDSGIPQLTAAGLIGAGQATQASSATGVGGVVATSIGVDLVHLDGRLTPIDASVGVPISDLSITPDSRHAVVRGVLGTELWMLGTTPTLVRRFEAPATAAFSSDGTALIVSTPSQVTSSQLESDAEPTVVIVAPPGTALGTATTTSDGAVIAAPVTGDGADLIVYTPGTGPLSLDLFAEPERTILRAQFTERGDRLVLQVSSANSSADPFRFQLASLGIEGQRIDSVTDLGTLDAESPWALGVDGRILVVDGSTVRLIGSDGSEAQRFLPDARLSATSVTASRSGYAIALTDGSIQFTDLDAQPTAKSPPFEQPLIHLESLSGADGVISVHRGGEIRSWSSDGTLIGETASYRAAPVNDVAFSPDDTSVAFASTNGTVALSSVIGTLQSREFESAEGKVDSLAFSPDGRSLLTGVGERVSETAFNDMVSLWNVTTGTRIMDFGGEGEDVDGCGDFRNAVDFSPDGRAFAAASHDFTVVVYDGNSAETLHVLPPHVSTVLDIAFSPSGDRLVTSSDDGSVRVWQVDDAELLTEFVAPPGGYWSLAFMPDGESIIVTDLIGVIHRVDVNTGTELLEFGGATTRTSRVAVSPDGAYIAAASDGNSVGIWSTATGELVARAEGHAAPVASAAFSSDGSTLVTGSSDATVRLWRLG